MPAITARAVKDLRTNTGAGMMACKKALVESNGNTEVAVDWLRKKGLAAAQKKSTRVAAEGVIAVQTAGNTGAMIEMNAETDFVSRNETFQMLARNVVASALEHKGDEVAMKAAPVGSAANLDKAVTQHIASIGENLTFSRATYLAVESGVVASYAHSALAEGLGRIGIMVGLQWQDAAGDAAALAEVGKRIAMHIAAAKPDYVHRDEIPAEVVARERTVLSEQAVESGKPANVIEKMVEGRMKRFFSEVVLLDQTFVIDNETLIADLVTREVSNVGAPFSITAFQHFILGENVEKVEQDFSAEVALMVNGQ
ncbi:MAG: elongation factor Ts [Alphaproteobacteria bacterium]|nr:elongation factor Ts [Alphaproteobacteria bacterium]